MKSEVEIVPIYIGKLEEEQEVLLSEVLEEAFNREDSLMIFCSNLSDWGDGKMFTEENKKPKDYEIFEHIEKMDKECMKCIEKQHLREFEEFVEEAKIKLNGKTVISVMIRVGLGYQVLEQCNFTTITRFIRYSQSNHAIEWWEKSVSYGAAISYSQKIK